MSNKVFFISGIDTDSGKTIATGFIAKSLINRGKTVITQKLAQTGCTGISTDIIKHRELMGIDLQEEDRSLITCPYCFKLAASPHLSARLENKRIELDVITQNTKTLLSKYNYVLLEGAGGIMVPLNNDYLIIDYIKQQNLPLILVTSAKIGSINHTLLSLEACKRYSINLIGILYNHYPEVDKEIFDDTKAILKQYLNIHYPEIFFFDLPIQNDTISSFLSIEL